MALLKNIFFYAILAGTLFHGTSTLCMAVKRMLGDDEAFKVLLQRSVKFAHTGSSLKTGPDINSLVKPNRKFIAKMDSFGANRFWTFETNAGANQIQQGLYDGGGMSIEWYYLDANQDLQRTDKTPSGMLQTIVGCLTVSVEFIGKLAAASFYCCKRK